MNVPLLFGIYHNGCVLRNAQLRMLTGQVEQKIIDVLGADSPTPVKVSQLISCFVQSVDDIPMSQVQAGRLTMADRQLLVLHLAYLLDGDHVWLHPRCQSCQEIFDVGYQRSQLPVSKISEQAMLDVHCYGIRVVLAECQWCFRLPCGDDQVAIFSLPETDAVKTLLKRIVLSSDTNTRVEQDALIDKFDDGDIEYLAQRIEEASPQLAEALTTECPNCQVEQSIALDPYQITQQNAERLLKEIHHLAIHYHWSEASILSLSRERRRQYITLINASGGYHE